MKLLNRVDHFDHTPGRDPDCRLRDPLGAIQTDVSYLFHASPFEKGGDKYHIALNRTRAFNDSAFRVEKYFQNLIELVSASPLTRVR